MQSSKKNDQIQEEIEVLSVDKLQKQFLNLQQDWESFKKSNHRKRKTLEPIKICPFSSSKSDNKHSNNLMVKTLDLITQSSPRSLMSSLQFHSKNGSMNSAVRDRREAIQSGSLKGRRRLFESYVGFGDNNNNNGEENNIHVSHEVRSIVSFEESDGENDIDVNVPAVWLQGYSCPLSGQRMIERSKMMMKKKKKKKERDKGVSEKMRIGNNNGKRPYNVVLMIIQWFVVLCVVFAICIFRGFGDHFDIDESEVILVPT